MSIRPGGHMQICKKGTLTHQFGHYTETQAALAHTSQVCLHSITIYLETRLKLEMILTKSRY